MSTFSDQQSKIKYTQFIIMHDIEATWKPHIWETQIMWDLLEL